MAQVAVCSQINTKHINTVWAKRTVVAILNCWCITQAVDSKRLITFLYFLHRIHLFLRVFQYKNEQLIRDSGSISGYYVRLDLPDCMTSQPAIHNTFPLIGTTEAMFLLGNRQ